MKTITCQIWFQRTVRKMTSHHPRIAREKKTVEAMIKIFCKGHHKPKTWLCVPCDELLNYAHSRLEKCPLSDEKPTCARCTIHCYIPVMQGKIKAVMRYSGPRMAIIHPYLALMHAADSRKKTQREPPRETL